MKEIYAIWKQLLAFWPSIWKWYKRKCDFSGETIITTYPDNARFPVYKYEYFISDKWDTPFLEFDEKKTFFEQLKKLQELCPRPHMLWANNENCDYCDDAWSSNSCYLSMSMLECENLYYSYRNVKCVNCSDIVYSHNCENCHDLIYCKNCYKVFYSFNAINCSESMFLFDCENVKNCFMCWNLKGKQYCIENKQYTKEEYEKKIKEINISSRKTVKKLKEKFEKLIKENALMKENININCENVSWNYLTNCKNCTDCFFLEESEDCKYILRWYNNKKSSLCTGLLNWENCYMVWQSSYVYNLKYSSYCERCEDSEYLDNCQYCKNCFGCVWLRNKQYCILNKQYTKEEYEQLVKKIKEKMKKDREYWQFLPYNMMYSWYNTTLARIFFPDTKENILKLWWYWEDDDNVSNVVWYDLPDNIHDTPDDISDKVIICIKTWRPFNFIPQVVKLHKKLNIPLPDVYHIDRMVEMYKPLAYIKPYKWVCSKCWKDIIHYYPDNLWYKNIVCQECYNKEIY